MSSVQGTKKATREPVVQRSYDPAPRACSDAVALLLQNPVAKKKAAGVTSTNGDDATKGSLKHEDRATEKYTG